MFTTFTPETNKSEKIAVKHFSELVGDRCRYVPTRVPSNAPVKEFMIKSSIRSEINALEDLLRMVEMNKDFTRDDMLAELHMKIINANNTLTKYCNQTPPMEGPEVFTDRYCQEGLHKYFH